MTRMKEFSKNHEMVCAIENNKLLQTYPLAPKIDY